MALRGTCGETAFWRDICSSVACSKIYTMYVKKRSYSENLCEELRIAARERTAKELGEIYPEVLYRIFGHAKTDPGLPLWTPYRNLPENDCKSINTCLSSSGPVFHIISRIMKEVRVKYDCPLDRLSKATQNIALQKSGYLFQKLTRPSISLDPVLQLDALELFLVMFANSAAQQKGETAQNLDTMGEMLYSQLLDDYLGCFLPVAVAPITQSLPAPLKSGPTIHNAYEEISGLHSPHTSSLYNISSLYSTSVTRQPFGNYSNSPKELQLALTFIMTIGGCWLCCEQPSLDLLSDQVTPNQEVVPNLEWIVVLRHMVKHLHRFLYQLHAPGNQSSTTAFTEDVLRMARDMVCPYWCMGIYHTLLAGFNRTSYDSTLRYSTELWLSYIQPWRYMVASAELAVLSGPLQLDTWRQFVEWNTVIYRIFFQRFIMKALKMDLKATTRHLQLIHKVLKVFHEPGLLPLILQDNSDASLRRPSRYSETNLMDCHESVPSGFSPWSTTVSQAVALCMKMMAELQTQHKDGEDCPPNTESLGDSEGSSARRAYLEKNIDLLTAIFSIQDQVESLLNKIAGSDESFSSWSSGTRVAEPVSIPDHSVAADGSLFLTDIGRLQVILGTRKFDVQSQSDPETLEPRSYEIASFVWAFYPLSQCVNDLLGDSMLKLYNREDVLGRVLRRLSLRHRVFLEQPVATRSVSSTPVRVRPRLSLRFLASFYTLLYLLVFWVLVGYMVSGDALRVGLFVLLLAILLTVNVVLYVE